MSSGMIEKFKQPTSFFEFRRIVFLILQETLEEFTDAVVHQDPHGSDGHIKVRFNEKTKCDFLPDQNLVFMTDWHYKRYLEFEEQYRQAKLADAEEDDEDEDGDDDDQGDDDTPPGASPEIEFSVN